MSTDITAEQLNKFTKLVKERWDDNSVEAVIGLLSTVITGRQLEVLIDDLTEQLDDYEMNIPTGRSLRTVGEW